MRSIPMYVLGSDILTRRYVTAIKNSFIQQLRAVRFYVHRKHPGLLSKSHTLLNPAAFVSAAGVILDIFGSHVPYRLHSMVRKTSSEDP